MENKTINNNLTQFESYMNTLIDKPFLLFYVRIFYITKKFVINNLASYLRLDSNSYTLTFMKCQCKITLSTLLKCLIVVLVLRLVEAMCSNDKLI